MRTFLVTAVLTFGGLVTAAALTTQDPPPAHERAPLELTPAEIELVLYYLDLRTAELEANPTAFRKIMQKYDDLVRRSLPPEKYLSAKPYMGC